MTQHPADWPEAFATVERIAVTHGLEGADFASNGEVLSDAACAKIGAQLAADSRSLRSVLSLARSAVELRRAVEPFTRTDEQLRGTRDFEFVEIAVQAQDFRQLAQAAADHDKIGEGEWTDDR